MSRQPRGHAHLCMVLCYRVDGETGEVNSPPTSHGRSGARTLAGSVCFPRPELTPRLRQSPVRTPTRSALDRGSQDRLVPLSPGPAALGSPGQPRRTENLSEPSRPQLHLCRGHRAATGSSWARGPCRAGNRPPAPRAHRTPCLSVGWTSGLLCRDESKVSLPC